MSQISFQELRIIEISQIITSGTEVLANSQFAGHDDSLDMFGYCLNDSIESTQTIYESYTKISSGNT